MKSILRFGFLLIVLSGCSSSDDEMMLCATGPVGFPFKVINKTTGQNIFEAGIYEADQMSIENQAGETIDFNLESSRYTIDVLLGWETKADTYTVRIGEEITFEIDFRLERSKGEFCSSTRLREFRINGATYEKSATTGITEIFVMYP